VETILLLVHTDSDGQLPRAALETLTAARQTAGELGAAFSVGLVGADVTRAAGSIANCGAARFLAVSGEEFGSARYATDAAAAEALARAAGATLILAPGTSRWARVAAGVAQRLGGRIDTHATGVADGTKITRWYYRQRMEAVLTRSQRPWIVLLDGGCFEAWQGEAGTSVVESIAVNLTGAHQRTSVTGFQTPSSGTQTIRPDAELLFVTGAGWTKTQADGNTHTPEAAKLILGFLGLTKASLGSSKSLVDLSGEGQTVLPFLSHLNQVGQTGATPRHPKGLATCCHGEEPHVVGWRFVNDRRAVNLDPNCGWARGKADVVYVADAFAVMAKVSELLTQQPGG
jgi:electron transfer flavoprotein alpha subunit